MTKKEMENRIREYESWAYAYDWDYEPDDPSNLAEDYRVEAQQLREAIDRGEFDPEES